MSIRGEVASAKHGAPGENDGLLRVRFVLPRDSDDPDWPPSTAELMWAEPCGSDRAILRNVPFYARGVAFGDLIATRIGEEDEAAVFEGVVRHNGHSTYRLVIIAEEPEAVFPEWWPRLADLGCTYERADRILIAIDMAPNVDVREAYRILETGEKEGVWDFEEGFYYKP